MIKNSFFFFQNNIEKKENFSFYSIFDRIDSGIDSKYCMCESNKEIYIFLSYCFNTRYVQMRSNAQIRFFFMISCFLFDVNEWIDGDSHVDDNEKNEKDGKYVRKGTKKSKNVCFSLNIFLFSFCFGHKKKMKALDHILEIFFFSIFFLGFGFRFFFCWTMGLNIIWMRHVSA